MDNEEAVEPQDVIETITEQPMENTPEVDQEVDYEQQIQEQESRTKVPLSALQKERKKRQELEMRLEYMEKQQAMKQEPVEDDNSAYESATRADLRMTEAEIVRKVEEKLWIKQNPEKYERINEYLPEFLKQRPNLAQAIKDSPNRYEEAYTLMDALTPKQQQQLAKQAAPKKEAPNSPSSVPKATAMNHAVDVMTMSDEEFSKWRQAQKRR